MVSWEAWEGGRCVNKVAKLCSTGHDGRRHAQGHTRFRAHPLGLAYRYAPFVLALRSLNRRLHPPGQISGRAIAEPYGADAGSASDGNRSAQPNTPLLCRQLAGCGALGNCHVLPTDAATSGWLNLRRAAAWGSAKPRKSLGGILDVKGSVRANRLALRTPAKVSSAPRDGSSSPEAGLESGIDGVSGDTKLQQTGQWREWCDDGGLNTEAGIPNSWRTLRSLLHSAIEEWILCARQKARTTVSPPVRTGHHRA